MKRITYLFLGVSCLFLSFLLFGASKRAEDERLAAEIAPGILRFHILANSNKGADQELKLEVRSFLLDEIYRGLSADTGGADGAESGRIPGAAVAKDAVTDYINTNAGQLEDSAELYIRRRGYSYPVSIQVEDTYFPTKYYGDIRLPCGTYQAVNVAIGEGRGHNWWCVLYPRLCFVDKSWAVLPEESKKELEQLTGEETYRELVCQRPKLELGLLQLFFPEEAPDKPEGSAYRCPSSSDGV